MVIEQVEAVGGLVPVWASPRTDAESCPDRGAASARVHSRYVRRLADAPVAGRRLEIALQVRREPRPAATGT